MLVETRDNTIIYLLISSHHRRDTAAITVAVAFGGGIVSQSFQAAATVNCDTEVARPHWISLFAYSRLSRQVHFPQSLSLKMENKRAKLKRREESKNILSLVCMTWRRHRKIIRCQAWAGKSVVRNLRAEEKKIGKKMFRKRKHKQKEVGKG